MKRRIAGIERRKPRTGRYLRVEPLESRAMLSVMSPLPPGGVAAEPFAESVPALVDVDTAIVERDISSAPRPLLAAMKEIASDASAAPSPGQSDADLWRDVESAFATSDLRLPFPTDTGSRIVIRSEVELGGANALRVNSIEGGLSVAGTSRWEFPDDLKLNSTPDELSALVAGGNRRDLVDFQDGSVELRPDGASEGGFIVLGNPIHFGEEIQLDRFHAMDTQTFSARDLRPLDQIATMGELASGGEIEVPLSAASEIGGELGTLTRDAAENAVEMHAQEESGATALSGFDAVDGKISAGSTAAQSDTTARVEADVKQQLEAEVARETDPGDDSTLRSELPRLDESLIRTQFSNLDTEVDGHRIVAESSERSASRSERRSDKEDLSRSAATSISIDASKATDSRDVASQFGEQARESQPDANDGSDAAGELSQWAFGLEEGGTIDLVAAAFLRQQNGGAVAAPTDDQPSIGAQDVRMDKAIGLFQAFELSTAPTERAGQITLTSASADEQPLLAPLEAGASGTPVVPAVQKVSEAVSKESDKPQDSHRAALPSVVVAFLLSAAGRRWREDGSTEWKWLRLSD